MRFSPLWNHSTDGSSAARFSVGVNPLSEEVVETEIDPLESLRCDILVALSDRLTSASISHPHLAPVLMDGLDNALERLPLLGHELELRSIQQWLGRESSEKR